MTPHASRLLLPALGFTIWSVAFVLIYGSLSFGCAFGWDEVRLAGPLSLQRAQLVVLFALATAGVALAAFALRSRHRSAEAEAPASFLRAVGYGAAVAAFGATIATFAPVLVLTSC